MAAYIDAILGKLQELNRQSERIEEAARLCAERIARGRVVHVFGAGHSRMMCEEAYPRIGAVVGFRPVVELAITFFHNVVGPNGLKQALFLERVPGYGRLIFEALEADEEDVTIVFSSSGVEAIILDYVEAARERGVKVVGVTSLAYSETAMKRRGLVTRLADVADVVIDNQVPVGDALVEIEGLPERVGPSASILNLAVMDSITVATATELLRLGVEPLVFGSPHLVGEGRAEERLKQCLAEYQVRVHGSRKAAG